MWVFLTYGFSVFVLFIFLEFGSAVIFWFFVVFGVKISFPARNSVVVQEILPTWPEFQGFYLSRWVFIRTRVCDEPSFSGGPLDWFSDCQVWVFIVQFELFWFLHSPLFDFCCYGFVGFCQRLLKMADGLNFKDFVAFLSAFSTKASMPQKVQRRFYTCGCKLVF